MHVRDYCSIPIRKGGGAGWFRPQGHADIPLASPSSQIWALNAMKPHTHVVSTHITAPESWLSRSRICLHTQCQSGNRYSVGRALLAQVLLSSSHSIPWGRIEEHNTACWCLREWYGLSWPQVTCSCNHCMGARNQTKASHIWRWCSKGLLSELWSGLVDGESFWKLVKYNFMINT